VNRHHQAFPHGKLCREAFREEFHETFREAFREAFCGESKG